MAILDMYGFGYHGYPHGYLKWISIWISKMDIHVDIHVYYGYPTWMSIKDIFGHGYGRYPWISKIDIHAGYPCLLWISNMDILKKTWISFFISKKTWISFFISKISNMDILKNEKKTSLKRAKGKKKKIISI